MNKELEEIINKQNEVLKRTDNPNVKIGIIYNLITIKNRNKTTDNGLNFYVDIKMLVNYYVELVKTNDFGYDLLSEEKILKVIRYLSINEQQEILSFLFSLLSREFPEMQKEWVQTEIKRVKLKKIIHDQRIIGLPKALFLYTSMSICKLIISLFFFVIFVGILLLPAPCEWMAIFEIKYWTYSSNPFFNHILNIVSIFGDIENGCKIIALNWIGLCVQIMGKILFILVIVNFIYKKISDKIALG